MALQTALWSLRSFPAVVLCYKICGGFYPPPVRVFGATAVWRSWGGEWRSGSEEGPRLGPAEGKERGWEIAHGPWPRCVAQEDGMKPGVLDSPGRPSTTPAQGWPGTCSHARTSCKCTQPRWSWRGCACGQEKEVPEQCPPRKVDLGWQHNLSL